VLVSDADGPTVADRPYIGFAVADDEWARAHLAALPRLDDPFEVTRLGDGFVGAVSDRLDCVVIDRSTLENSPEPLEQLLGQVHPDVPVLLVVQAVADRDVAREGLDPTAVFIRGAEPQPRALARRLDLVTSAATAANGHDPSGEWRQSLFEAVPVPMAVSADETIVYTNPAYKATFGLAERLPPGCPEPPADGDTVECETLGDCHEFVYTTVACPGDLRIHVLRGTSVSPTSVADEVASTDEGRTWDALEALTDRQREVLAVAHDGGFFERPKESNSDELAAQLDITRSTFLQHLRAAERKIFDAIRE
jgi:DNA-binding CsgD family transcriptional regulator